MRPLLTLLLSILLAQTLWAQPIDLETASEAEIEAMVELIENLRDGDLADLGTERYDEELWARAAREALVQGKNIRARELTQQILDRDPDSFVGHCMMGVVQHRAEGNLPRGVYHLELARRIFEGRYGSAPGPDDPWRWHARILSSLASVKGEMGRHEEKIELLLEHDQLYSPPQPADRGWPLMRLRRYDEARRAVAEALLLEDQPDQVAHALTALCAIEAELQDREKAYRACLDAADFERLEDYPGPTPFTNAAEATFGLLRFDEAENLVIEASEHFLWGTVSNPWLDLTQLYLAQGRTAEALEAVREMFTWRRRQPPFMDEQNRAETELTSAVFLLVAGHEKEAARITKRAVERPDRTGFTSSESEQLEAASALADTLVARTLMERRLEEASWSGPWDRAKALAAALDFRLRAWTSARRAAALLADERILLATLRPYLAGAVELPEWLEPELVSALGPGVVRAALDDARNAETLAEAEGYFLAYEAEAAFLAGDEKGALALVDRALRTLPGAEVLLRARMAVRGAQAAEELGLRSRSLELFDQALQMDPGSVRRLGAALPATIEAAPGPISAAAAKALRRSPRFTDPDGRGGFRVTVEGLADSGEAHLVGPRGTRFASARVTPRAGETSEDLGRRLARTLHEEAFALRVDLTQSDLSSLDGSPTAAGGRSRERMTSVLKDLVDDSE